MKKPKKIDLEGSWVTWATIGFGLRIYCLFTPDSPAPKGFCWGYALGGKKTKFLVHGSYVIPWARRSGVRTRINEQILRHCPVIQTFSGSRQGGAAFMRARGYRYSAAQDTWSLVRRPAPRRAAKQKKGRP